MIVNSSSSRRIGVQNEVTRLVRAGIILEPGLHYCGGPDKEQCSVFDRVDLLLLLLLLLFSPHIRVLFRVTGLG
jgi:hypothetical protein